jgi:site-specific DNA recombinase
MQGGIVNPSVGLVGADVAKSLETATPLLNAVFYLRVSTKEQAQRGGQAEGFSIPAQREACERKLRSLNAIKVAEFVDAESGTTASRREFQKLLKYVHEETVHYVIVHKLDRLIRNRFDDFQVTLTLQKAGVKLVSCSEAIDETAAGQLNQGLLAVINEWYSRNLGQEMKAKQVMKVRNGGTIGRAPIGYLNVHRRLNGQQVATVELDPDRAPLVRWAFEAYATGEWSLTALTETLAAKGLTTVPTQHYTEKPLPRANVHRMLRNRYYIGKFTWGKIEYDGSHPQLIESELFERVQEVLTAHNLAGEKQRVHRHYLKGSVWCGSCGSRLVITKTTNRHGQRYEYFFCVGRNQKRTPCMQKAIPIELVERRIEEKWRNVRLDPEYAELLRQILEQEISLSREQADRDLSVANRQIAILKEQQQKALHAHYAGAISLELLTQEQRRIDTEIAAAQSLKASTQVTYESIDVNLRRCLAFLTDAHQAYLEAGPQVRRRMNQSVFKRFLVSEDGSTEAELTPLFGLLLAPDLLTSEEKKNVEPGPDAVEEPHARVHRNCEWRGGVPAWLHALWPRYGHGDTRGSETDEPRPFSFGLGSNKTYLAERAGFEPATRLSTGTRFPVALLRPTRTPLRARTGYSVARQAAARNPEPPVAP